MTITHKIFQHISFKHCYICVVDDISILQLRCLCLHVIHYCQSKLCVLLNTATCWRTADFLTKILCIFITSLMNVMCLTHLILLGATSKLVKSSFYQLNGFTYRTGLVPMVRITLRAMRLCKLQCSTAIAAMRPPAQYSTSVIMTVKHHPIILYQWFYATININFHTHFYIHQFCIAREGIKMFILQWLQV